MRSSAGSLRNGKADVWTFPVQGAWDLRKTGQVLWEYGIVTDDGDGKNPIEFVMRRFWQRNYLAFGDGLSLDVYRNAPRLATYEK